MNRRHILSAGTALAGLLAAFRVLGLRGAGPATAGPFEVVKSDAAWRQELAPEAYAILRGHGTERPGSSPLNREKAAGRFACAACDLPLFSSQTKFESGTGWPSFWAPLDGAIGTTTDTAWGMSRTEVHCRRCGGHLGHVFADGPPPTGQRYCMNGAGLRFHPA
ncbi:peptide-methionine (R)-S-oxide reductase MsrB [uncultured Methylobacterium sp.]|uniref:peptide-methionine (R)-S-oxide reductase MsrB n=1 Tax=uncultured Methylobacterium sp. TaxID=157278 RepID=UPI0035C959E4